MVNTLEKFERKIATGSLTRAFSDFCTPGGGAFFARGHSRLTYAKTSLNLVWRKPPIIEVI